MYTTHPRRQKPRKPRPRPGLQPPAAPRRHTISPHLRPHPPGCRDPLPDLAAQTDTTPDRVRPPRRTQPAVRKARGIHRPHGPVLPAHDAAVLPTARAGCPKPEGPAARWGISPRPPHRLQHRPALAPAISSSSRPGRLRRRRCGLLGSLRWRRLLHRVLYRWRLRFPRGRRDRRGQRGQVHDRVIPGEVVADVGVGGPVVVPSIAIQEIAEPRSTRPPQRRYTTARRRCALST